MKVLVAGAAGMLGSDLMLAAGNAGHDVVGFGHTELDVTDAAAVAAKLEAERPDMVINSAAWTDVDGAEEDEEAATRVNGEGARTLAAAAAAVDAGVVYVSSDYVFDGAKGEPYVESDQTNPQSAYGRGKLAGEEATAAANRRHFIVRSSWLFGIGGPNFVETMLRLAADHGEVLVVRDQVGSPDLHLAPGPRHRAADGGDGFGIHHMAGGGACSWYDFAREVFEQAAVVPGALGDDRDARPPRPAAALLGARQPAPARDRAAELAGRPRRLPDAAPGAAGGAA